MSIKEQLIQKYNIGVPRYTSYPTVPYWGSEVPDLEEIKKVIKTAFEQSNKEKGISLYIHLPYCEKLCTFCACTKVVTKNHRVEESYIKALLVEWRKYLELFEDKPIVRELHFGGGTPTFFSPENLKYLVQELLKDALVPEEHEYSFEAHPGNTTRAHLQALYEVGFNRVSFGVQDFDPIVQTVIGRVHGYEIVEKATQDAREIGYNSVNFDLIYGLPKQKVSSVEDTFEKVARLRPDRIAYYSYAHVPWKSKMQRLFTESDLPNDTEKRALYDKAKEKLNEQGYLDVGMDHFALEHDELSIAYKKRRLHRNFMGYNTSHTDVLIGLGASAISDFGRAYVQNDKNVKTYERALLNQQFAFERGYILSEEDLLIKQAILSIACKRELEMSSLIMDLLPSEASQKIAEMEEDKLIELKENKLFVTNLGMVFLRNICSVFDKKLYDSSIQANFSKSI